MNDGELNLFCFNAAISACEKGGAWVEALELYYQMMEKGGVVTPNFVTLSSLLIALDKAGQKEVAQDLYEKGLRKNIVRAPWTRTRCPRTGDLIRAMDLHNFSTAMTRTAIRSVLASLLTDGNEHTTNSKSAAVHNVKTDLVIIVGKGNGSRYGEQVLLPTVKTILEDDYGILCYLDPANAGRLVVSSEILQSFVVDSTWR